MAQKGYLRFVCEHCGRVSYSGKENEWRKPSETEDASLAKNSECQFCRLTKSGTRVVIMVCPGGRRVKRFSIWHPVGEISGLASVLNTITLKEATKQPEIVRGNTVIVFLPECPFYFLNKQAV